MTPPASSAISVQGLHYAYPPPSQGGAAAEVLRGVDFQVQPGEFVALVGRVGAGKTTLCMALNGLVPHATGGIFRGQVLVAGRDTRQCPVADLARTVGFVFQDPEMQLTQMRVDDEVAFGPENLGLPPSEIEERVAWALAAVGLEDHRERSPLQLSGGEKQRLAIAAVLAMRPEVLVLDEPTESLDPAGKDEVLAVLAGLARRSRATIVVATQELDGVARRAQRVLVLDGGRLVLDGSPREVFARFEQLDALGIGVPACAELAHRLSQRTGIPYHFTGFKDAYVQLRRHARSRRRALGREELSSEPPARAEPQVIAEHVSFRYPGGAPALRDVSVGVSPGELVALIGPNGSGKTTLAKHLNGLLKPQRGRVLVAGRDAAAMRPGELARHVGYVFQNPDHQIFSATVEEEVGFGLRLQGLPRQEVARRTAAALEAHGLAEHAGRPPALLGMGQRRQVALASVLVMEPPLLILDEPTGGLDARARTELMAILARYCDAGRAVMLITHDMRLVAEHATRAVVMAGGQILFDGAPRALFADGRTLARAGLALPAVTRLARRLRLRHAGLPVLTSAEFLAAWGPSAARGRGAAPAEPGASGVSHAG